MTKPKFVKPLLIGVACTIPVGLVVGLSVNWDNTQFISAVGSSAVKPYIESFAKQYHQQFSNFDVMVESIGTTAGVEQLAQGYADLGNASCNPYSIVNGQGYLDRWNDKKTFTLGWEGLILMYILPKEVCEETRQHFEIVITENNILPLYGVFSGFHELKNETWDPLMDSLWYYATKESQDWVTANHPEDIDPLKNTQIMPFVRAGGNNGSNSSIAFSYYSNLTNPEVHDMSYMTENQQKAFAFGQYGDDGLEIKQTDDSNARAWDSFHRTNQGGSMVYLTSSFIAIEGNREAMKEAGYKLAGYQPRQTTKRIFIDGTKDSLAKICSVDGYNWYRPINTMVDLDLKKAKDFVYWMFIGSHEDMPLSSFTEQSLSQNYKDIMFSKGAKPLNADQFLSMCYKSQGSETLQQILFDVQSGDLALNTQRQGSDIFKDIYGAEDLWK